jgi:hypothetical protein
MRQLFGKRLTPRTVSPSLHSCSASGGASSFLPASALAHHRTLRSDSGEDARCVQPTSATRTTCVHPYLVRSRFTAAAFAARTSRGVWAPRDLPGDPRFHDLGTASADRHRTLFVPATSSPRDASVGVVFPRCRRCDRASDTPVAIRIAPRFTRLRACDSRARLHEIARLEREPNRRGHRDHPLMKGDGS